MRAEGGFGLTITCASHVQAIGKGFPGQPGIWSDEHIPGLTRLVNTIHSHESIALAQLHHGGYAIGTQNLHNPKVEWDGGSTYIQKEGILRDLGTFETPDEYLKRKNCIILLFIDISGYLSVNTQSVRVAREAP